MKTNSSSLFQINYPVLGLIKAVMVGLALGIIVGVIMGAVAWAL